MSKASSNQIQGVIAEIDASGNLVTDITSVQLAEVQPLGDQVRILCDSHETFGIFSPSDEFPEFTFVALLPKTGNLQLTIIGESAADMLRIPLGAEVTVSW